MRTVNDEPHTPKNRLFRDVPKLPWRNLSPVPPDCFMEHEPPDAGFAAITRAWSVRAGWGMPTESNSSREIAQRWSGLGRRVYFSPT